MPSVSLRQTWSKTHTNLDLSLGLRAHFHPFYQQRQAFPLNERLKRLENPGE